MCIKYSVITPENKTKNATHNFCCLNKYLNYFQFKIIKKNCILIIIMNIVILLYSNKKGNKSSLSRYSKYSELIEFLNYLNILKYFNKYKMLIFE